MHCPACQHENPATARFCQGCGTRLAAPAPASAGPAERRQVTVVFCDLVESTALSHRVDPEDLRDLVHAYHELCTHEIERLGGHVAQYLGDGVLAYFGYPVAHEQDAQAAVRAGLAIVEAMGRGAADRPDRVAVRIGIHSGLVVAGEVGVVGKRELLAVGSTPNVAARVQGVARPDSVVISAATHRLVEGFFDCVALGPQVMKGLVAPLEVYEVRAETEAQSRVAAAPAAGLTPLVGRDAELAVLVERWATALAGRRQVVLVAGEAGLGKSRLLVELKNRLGHGRRTVLECRCSPFFESSALFPVIDLLQRAWRLGRVTSPEEKVARLEAAVARYVPDVPDAVPLLAAFLSIPLPVRHPPLEVTPQLRKERTLDALVTIVAAIAAEEPVLFVVEDLHWIDPSTLELLQLLVERVATARLMVLLLFRPTFACPWTPGEDAVRIDLVRLGSDETTAMIGRVTGGRRLPLEVERTIGEKADGVPLYVEELTKMVLESGALVERNGRYELARPLALGAVPMTLQESLMARLDRLAPAREVLQLGATIGRAFSYELLRAVCPVDEPALRAELARLVDAEVLHAHGTPPDATYVFKHALIQDAAYESLLKGRRREHHLRIADVIERRFPDVGETQPELLAHHWAGAGRAAEAIGWYLRAGRRAAERSADVEATTHLQKGLALLPDVADASDRARRELELRIALGPVLVGTKGYSDPEVEQVYARARELCDEVGGDPRLRFTVSSGLLLFHQSRAEIEACLELTSQRFDLAREIGEPALEMLVYENAGTLAYWRGEHRRALAFLGEALARYTPERGRTIRLEYGTDTSVVSTIYEGMALFYLGHPDQAIHKGDEAIALARALGHVHSLVLALNFTAALRLERGEFAAAARLAEEQHAIASEQHLALWVGASIAQRGQVLVGEGRPDEGIAAFFEGMTTVQATGATIAGRYWTARLAHAYLAAGRAEEGLAACEAMLSVLARCEDVFYDSEIARAKGRLLLAASRDRDTEAEACFHEALALARARGARLLELRAATSLAELWATTGRRAEGRRLLGAVLGSFTEGFDTLDLRDAAALLAELTRQEGRTARTST